MNRIYFVFALLLFLSTAFTSIDKTTNTQTNPAVFKLMEITYLWDLLKEGYEPDKDRDGTWLEVGFRSKYAMAKQYAALNMIEAAFGEKVFLSGPHGSDMDFNSSNSFGHYNPAFITALHNTLSESLGNPMFKEALEKLYSQQLMTMAKIHFDAYYYLQLNPEYLQLMLAQYESGINNSEGMNFNEFTNNFDAFSQIESERGLDLYEGFNAPAFWLRRIMDGTDQQMIELLEMAMGALDPNFNGELITEETNAFTQIIAEQLAVLAPTVEHEYTILTKDRVADALQTDAGEDVVKEGILLAEGSLAALGWFVLYGNDDASYQLADKLAVIVSNKYNGTDLMDLYMMNQGYSEMINLKRFNNQKPAMVSTEYAEIVQERINQAFVSGAGYDEFRLAEGSLVALGWVTAYGNDQTAMDLGDELMNTASRFFPESDGYYMKQSSEAYAEIINLGRFSID